MTKVNAFGRAKESVRQRRYERRARRREEWTNRFPFNLLGEMLRGITGNPR